MGIFANLQRILSNGLRLPAAIVQPGSITGPLPKTAEDILFGHPGLHLVARAPGQFGQVQYLKTPYEERFVYMRLIPDQELWIGPLLTHPVGEGHLADIIRTHKLPIRKKTALASYYAALPILTENEFFYAGQLAQKIMADSEIVEKLPDIGQREDTTPVLAARHTAQNRLDVFEHPPYFMELEMSRLVTTGDMESALHTMNRINTFSRATLAREPVRSLKNSLICNCTFLARAAIAGGVSHEEAFALSDRLILRAEDTNSIQELEEQERQILMEFVELVHTYNTSHYSKPVREAIRYIRKHLSEKIRLEDLGRAIFMHPNYICALFKRETGQTITQFILAQRVEEAKFFLRYTQNGISDIAAFYQFSSESYFIRKFGEIVGTTPLKYRKSSG